MVEDRKPGIVKIDRWIFWPTFASLGVVLILTLVCGLPGLWNLLTITILMLGCAVAGIVLLIVIGVLVAMSHLRRAASVFLVLIGPVLLWSPINWVAECVHLGLTVGFGAGQLGSSSKPDGKDFEVFDWSVGLAGGPNTFLIHDKSDQIALPMNQHTQPPESENGFGEDCAGKVSHLLGHYYVCTF
jgi:hypothetical protein